VSNKQYSIIKGKKTKKRGVLNCRNTWPLEYSSKMSSLHNEVHFYIEKVHFKCKIIYKERTNNIQGNILKKQTN